MAQQVLHEAPPVQQLLYRREAQPSFHQHGSQARQLLSLSQVRVQRPACCPPPVELREQMVKIAKIPCWIEMKSSWPLYAGEAAEPESP